MWALAVCSRRYRQRGGDPALITAIAIWAVPAGVLGAHLYHVITDYELYLPRHGHPLTLKVWDGGLGIWGGVAAGALFGAAVARRHGARAGNAGATHFGSASQVQSRRPHPSVPGYKHWPESGDYSAILQDGALLQISYQFAGNQVDQHRLAYVSCPYPLTSTEISAFE